MIREYWIARRQKRTKRPFFVVRNSVNGFYCENRSTGRAYWLSTIVITDRRIRRFFKFKDAQNVAWDRKRGCFILEVDFSRLDFNKIRKVDGNGQAADATYCYR